MSRAVLFSVIVILLIPASAFSQVIHKDGLNSFVARFSCSDDPTDRNNKIIDYDSLLDWRVLDEEIYTKGQQFQKLLQEGIPGSCWLRSWSIPVQQGKPKVSIGRFFGEQSPYMHMTVHVLGDMEFKAYAYSIISFWKKRGLDSLEYAGACVNPAQLGGTLPAVILVTAFPDGSLMVVTEASWSDAEDIKKRTSFLKETAPGVFEEFYTVTWWADYSQGSNKRVIFDFKHCYYPSSTALQITEFFRVVPDEKHPLMSPVSVKVIDSAWAEPVDLWKLAVDHFDIDTMIYYEKPAKR
jgi:hypothetical protein